jgi:uncharacterized RmlC-like cupin family protein
MLAPGEGHRIRGGALDATVKVSGGFGASTFELVIPPGYDVGAHVHASGEELFYVLDGMVDLLAYEPTVRTSRDWHDWMSRGGRRFLRGGPGSLLFVPAGSPRPERNRCPARQVRHRAAHAVARSEPTLTRPCS